MTISNKTYQVGDLFTTQKSKVTGVIKAIEPKSPNSTLVLLDVDGEERFTTVTF
jgi:predicted lipoprotein